MLTNESSIRSKTNTPSGETRLEARRVLRELDLLCDSVGVGGRIPRHTELMSRFGASQHHVIRSLEELQRRGRIIRRHGSGTFVTDQSPPQSASALRKPTIVAIARPDGSYFDRCVETLYSQTSAAKIQLVCRFVGASTEDMVELEDFGAPEGFILFNHALSGLAKRLHDAGNRVVLVGNPSSDDFHDIPCVSGHQDRGGFLLTKHLIDFGHRRIAYCSGKGDWLTSLRWRGHSKAIREAASAGMEIGFELLDHDTVESWHRIPSLASDHLTKREDTPTAIAAWNDDSALAIIATLTRAGFTIPGDISVIGYDYLPIGQRHNPSITTIDPMLEMQVAAAVDLITDINEPRRGQSIIFAPSLVVGESTGVPRGKVVAEGFYMDR